MEQYDRLLTGSWDIVAAIRLLAQRVTDLEDQVKALQQQQQQQPDGAQVAPSGNRRRKPQGSAT